ncbi:hypothetical protein NA56DRAFT_702612 [Hyaloscypha hepaticicola]|uniref:Uncharacterized protein n=1 Tax=Hyaloscypha hepaticicola TaxID=2082293 RepID=A0A2J6Q7N1_9HELO|nr:hypothetical protein NA56DRAFT_702612 [Hyaloscypha hepaticicola]
MEVESIGHYPWTVVVSLHGMNGVRFKTNLDSFSISAGDAGTVLCNGFTTPSAEAVLMRQHAEWIVEDFRAGDKLISVPFAGFGKVEWFECQAVTAPIMVIQENDAVLTLATLSDYSMTVTYTV